MTDKLLTRRAKRTRNRLVRRFIDIEFREVSYLYDGCALRLSFIANGGTINSHELLPGEDESRIKDALDALEAWALEAE